MKKPVNIKRIPIAFIDKTGYVTPFNGVFDTTISGWYLYTEEEVEAALAQQRQLEDNRIIHEREVTGVHFAIGDDEIENASHEPQKDDTPQWASNMFGAENVVPYLQIGKKENAPSATITPTVTKKDFHSEQSNVDLTPEEIAELGKEGFTEKELMSQIMGGK